MAFGQIVVALCSIFVLVASQFETMGDLDIVETNEDFCPGDTQPSNTDCVTSCAGLANGDYQSCTSCHKYVTCSNGITHKDRRCPARLVWDDNKKRCEWKSATCPPAKQNGVFYMNLEEKDLGADYIDGTTWQMLPGLPEAGIPAPTATGMCDTAVFYKFTPPACIKTLRFQITTNSSEEWYAFGVVDDDDVSQSEEGRTVVAAPLAVRVLVLDFNNSMSGAGLKYGLFTTPLCAQITPGVVSYSFSQEVGYTVIGDTFFKRMSSVPFTFSVNVDPFFMTPFAGVCSLKVAWSC